MTSFSRQVGHESGVQLNNLVDKSALAGVSVADRVFGTIGRFERGRIDRANLVDASNARAKLGMGAPVRVSQLNVALVHIIEALNNGAYESVVSRLVPSSAKIKWLVVDRADADQLQADPTKEFTFTVTEEEPLSGFLLAIKHMECFNDGIKVALHANSEQKDGMDVAVNSLTVRILDKDDNRLYEFTGTLDADALDDNGEPAWLPEVAAARTDNVVFQAIESGSIPPESTCYGDDDNGRSKWVTSPLMHCFDEGGTTYTAFDMAAARQRLRYTPNSFGYLASCGSSSIALLGHFALLSYDINTILKFDIPGTLLPDEAIAFMNQLNAIGQKEAHLLQAFWSPVKSLDPSGINGVGHYGVATLNIAYSCGRNAQTNAKGFAPKHYAVAGADWPINRQKMVQTYTCTGPELSKLAKAKINVICSEDYEGGSRFVFRDSLTCAPVSNSLKMLANVVDMATHTDHAFTRVMKAALQKPMDVSIKTVQDFAKKYFEGARDSGWTQKSDDPGLAGAHFMYHIRASEARPYDELVAEYGARWQGTNRVSTATQSLIR